MVVAALTNSTQSTNLGKQKNASNRMKEKGEKNEYRFGCIEI
jgi:hypothetical protein